METKKSLMVRQNELPRQAGKKGIIKSPAFSSEINKAWELYREQLQRNFELMKVISQQQQIIEQFVSGGVNISDKKEIAPAPETQVFAPSAEPELQYITYDRIAWLSPVYKWLVAQDLSRSDALANHLNMLYILWQLQEATPEKWFMQVCVPESTAYRYANTMRNRFVIKSVRGKYMLTSLGRMLIESKAGSPAEQEELLKRLKEESLLFSLNQHIPNMCSDKNRDFLNTNYRGM